MRTGNPRFQADGAWVPDWLVVRTEVSDSAKILYSRLVRWFDKRKGCAYVPQEELAKMLGKSVRTIQRLVAELVSVELIELRRKKSFANLYDTHFAVEHPWMKADPDIDLPEPPDVAAPETTDLTEITTDVAAPNTKEGLKKESPPTPQGDGRDLFQAPLEAEDSKAAFERKCETEFNEHFWPRFPQRDGGNPKQPALKAFIRQRRRYELSWVLEGLQTDLRHWTATKKIGTQYIPLASTWLNQARWDAKAGAGAAVEVELTPGQARDIRSFSQLDATLRQFGLPMGGENHAKRREFCLRNGINPTILNG